ncbi:hypothetical protein [Spongiactinospora sp. TRM90649]|uniref:hypothetical protein n=1 Tax=Spongiactinospora sp. TRM90649 TaxID=3031114 RepID=UPI0023F93A31|nr:hypothetical protein [Spongiactinospora sp. TRM90649]MDF5754886.1 hypothetical protein [Spongiactinospora sp. TRM90649]
MHLDSSHRDSPASAALVCWGNAWLAGHIGLDEAVDHIERTAGPGIVACPPSDDLPPRGSSASGSPTSELPGTSRPTELPLRAFLADLRVDGMTALRLALPVAGDPLGLTGPPSFNSAAIEAGQAAIAVLRGRCVGLVPEPDRRGSSYRGTRWVSEEAAVTIPDLPSLAEAERELSTSMSAVTEALAGVEGPRQARPDDALSAPGDTLAPGYPARAHRVAALSARLSVVLRLADDRGLTTGQVAARGEALRRLDHAVRRAQVAAHHAILEPRAS